MGGFISRFLFPRCPSSAWLSSVLFQSHKVKVKGWTGPCISPEALGKIPLRPPPGRWKPPGSSSCRAGFLTSSLAGGQGSLSSPRASCVTRLIFHLPTSYGGPNLSLTANLSSIPQLSSPSATCRICLLIPGKNDSVFLRARLGPPKRSKKVSLCRGPYTSREPQRPFAT